MYRYAGLRRFRYAGLGSYRYAGLVSYRYAGLGTIRFAGKGTVRIRVFLCPGEFPRDVAFPEFLHLLADLFRPELFLRETFLRGDGNELRPMYSFAIESLHMFREIVRVGSINDSGSLEEDSYSDVSLCCCVVEYKTEYFILEMIVFILCKGGKPLL